ncbi:MAG: hypothetical protein ACYDIE_06890 [Candidatus Krumholzibacteriia bacterium]
MSDGVKGRVTDRPSGLQWTRFALLVLVGLLAALAGAPAAVAAERGTWESIVLLYHSDVGGKVEPCG